MSDKQQANVTPQQAHNHVYQTVHAPAFFNKLAKDFGITPRTEQEAVDLLSMGARLQEQYHSDVKQAAAGGGSRYADVARELGIGDQSDASFQHQLKAAADSLAKDEQMARSVLTLVQAASQN